MFDDQTAILRFSRDTAPHVVGKSRTVLWPALGYRVTAHLPSPRKLNLFVRYVLRMCRAGMRHPTEIGEVLCLSPELVKFIMESAVQQGWLIWAGLLTPEGERVLEDDAAGMVEAKVGWLFRDAFDGTLWSRFVPDEGMQRAEGTLNVRAKLAEVTYGTKSRKHNVLLPPGIAQAAPSVREIGEALRQGQREEALHQMLKRGDSDFEYDDTLFSGVLQDEVAQPYFLVTTLFYPQDDTMVGTWMVADPFGYGIDTRMREVADTFAHQAGIQRDIDRLNDDVNRPSGSQQAHQLERQELQREGRALIEAKLDGLREVQPSAFNLFVGAASAAIRLHRDEQASGGTLNKGGWLAEQKRFLWQLYAGVELLAAETARSIEARGMLHVLGESRMENASFLLQQARLLGFEVDRSEEQAEASPARDPERVLNTIAGKVHAVVRFGDNDLASTLAYLILAVRRGDALPFRHASQEMPHLLSVLSELKARRGDVAHGGDPWFGSFEPLALLQEVLEACKYLGPVQFKSKAWIPGDALVLADGVRQTRARKRRAIGLEHERLVGRALRRFDKLAEELVDAALVLDEVLSDDAASSLGIRPLDAAIHLANVLEVLWRRVLEALPAMPEARWLPLNDRMALGARVAAAVKELGFVLPEDPQALEQVTRVKGNLIGKAIQRRSGSAGAAIATALLAGVNESGGALVKRLAVADPELIASCCTVLKARGHGDTSDLAAQEVQTLYQRTLALTRTMIDVLEPTARDHDREEHHV